ncbi:MAG: hypothetical protein DI637_01495 [Citromicrobium sp.]|nr:MAG: hypothetical protein DI637_01495 [Citromicrobium sp.]
MADGVWGPATAAAVAKALGIEAKPFDPAAFFASLLSMFGSFDQVQVDSINAMLSRMKGMPIQHVAYVLATAWHEARFTPQKE